MNWTPLQYMASLVLFGVIVTYVALRQWGILTKETFQANERMLWAWPLHIAYKIAGKTLGLLAWLASGPVWIVYALGDLWFRPLGRAGLRWWLCLDGYATKGQFYRPQHAR